MLIDFFQKVLLWLYQRCGLYFLTSIYITCVAVHIQSKLLFNYFLLLFFVINTKYHFKQNITMKNATDTWSHLLLWLHNLANCQHWTMLSRSLPLSYLFGTVRVEDVQTLCWFFFLLCICLLDAAVFNVVAVCVLSYENGRHSHISL